MLEPKSNSTSATRTELQQIGRFCADLARCASATSKAGCTKVAQISAALLLLSIPAPAQSLPNLRIAEAAYLASATADVVTSRGLVERNPILGRGPFGARQAAISMGISAGVVLATEALGRKFPKLRKPLTVVLWVSAGTRGAVAMRNGRLQ